MGVFRICSRSLENTNCSLFGQAYFDSWVGFITFCAQRGGILRSLTLPPRASTLHCPQGFEADQCVGAPAPPGRGCSWMLQWIYFFQRLKRWLGVTWVKATFQKVLTWLDQPESALWSSPWGIARYQWGNWPVYIRFYLILRTRTLKQEREKWDPVGTPLPRPLSIVCVCILKDTQFSTNPFMQKWVPLLFA